MPSSGGDCSKILSALHYDFHTIPPFTAALIAVPLLAGMFWAAPLVSREYEAGTHRLAWTQSVSPLRWLTIKIALIFGAIAAAALALGLLATWTLDPHGSVRGPI
jgi:ABC-type transport system involved in multi-copper enzyme maturation permease subunit